MKLVLERYLRSAVIRKEIPENENVNRVVNIIEKKTKTKVKDFQLKILSPKQSFRDYQ